MKTIIAVKRGNPSSRSIAALVFAAPRKLLPPPNPILPVVLRNFVFGAEDTNLGELQSVDASFMD
jgi:hypothetical protein